MSTDVSSLIPENEEERLAAVRRYDVLDTPPDGAFDRITALAARHFGVPISIVSIVDRDRIWFKSHHGLEVSEIGRDPGLCASAILQKDAWVVEDAAVDPRTLANPLVAGDFGLRFYAAAPLTTVDGHGLGTLCLLDTEPRELSEEETETLADLAAIVMDELELRLRAKAAVGHEQELRDQAERTARALQESLLPPKLPDIPGADLASLFRPADAAEVGGDFYDAFALDGGGWVLAVGDVSGKGAAGAAVTGLARHTIRTAALSSTDPGAILSLLNRAMFVGNTEGELDHFVTVHLTILESTEDGFTLRCAAAGHPAMLVARADGSVAPVQTAGPPVGWHADPAYPVTTLTLRPGDRAVVYTDGLSEARRDNGFVGEAGVAAELAVATDAADLVQRLLALLAESGVRAHDDAAALALGIR